MCGKVSCLRKQHDGRDWASNRRPSDLKVGGSNPSPYHHVVSLDKKLRKHWLPQSKCITYNTSKKKKNTPKRVELMRPYLS